MHTRQDIYLFAAVLRCISLYLQAKILKVKLLLALKDYSSVISESGFILKEDEDNLEALLVRGRAYYYLSDHDVALRFAFLNFYWNFHLRILMLLLKFLL